MKGTGIIPWSDNTAFHFALNYRCIKTWMPYRTISWFFFLFPHSSMLFSFFSLPSSPFFSVRRVLYPLYLHKWSTFSSSNIPILGLLEVRFLFFKKSHSSAVHFLVKYLSSNSSSSLWSLKSTFFFSAIVSIIFFLLIFFSSKLTFSTLSSQKPLADRCLLFCFHVPDQFRTTALSLQPFFFLFNCNTLLFSNSFL